MIEINFANLMKKCLFVCMILALISCAPEYKVDYEFVPPQNEQAEQCIHYCQESKNRCEKLCYEQGEECVTSNYQSSQCRRPETCSCEADYQACYKLCGGNIITKKTCISNCDTP